MRRSTTSYLKRQLSWICRSCRGDPVEGRENEHEEQEGEQLPRPLSDERGLSPEQECNPRNYPRQAPHHPNAIFTKDKWREGRRPSILTRCCYYSFTRKLGLTYMALDGLP